MKLYFRKIILKLLILITFSKAVDLEWITQFLTAVLLLIFFNNDVFVYVIYVAEKK